MSEKHKDCIDCGTYEKPKEFNLSKKIRKPIRMDFKEDGIEAVFKAKTTYEIILVKNVKEFIRRESVLIKELYCYEITMREFWEKRDKLAGDDLNE